MTNLKRLFIYSSTLLGLVSPLSLAAAVNIYHGDAVTSDQQFPFVVAVYNTADDPDDADCTGTVIAARWALTASHCVVNMDDQGHPTPAPAKDFFIGTGYKAGAKENIEQKIQVTKIITFPPNSKSAPDNYGLNIDHDFALLKLQDAAPVAPVHLPTNNNENSNSYIEVGYGWQDIKNWSAACYKNPLSDDCTFEPVEDNALHYGDETMIDDAAAISLIENYVKNFNEGQEPEFAPNQFINYKQELSPQGCDLAVTSPDGKHGSNGDSGGPLLAVTYDNNSTPIYTEIGVTSWGLEPVPKAMPQAYNNIPGIFVDLRKPVILNYIEFILKTQ